LPESSSGKQRCAHWLCHEQMIGAQTCDLQVLRAQATFKLTIEKVTQRAEMLVPGWGVGGASHGSDNIIFWRRQQQFECSRQSNYI
jgi:hypothetical protein